MPRYANSLQVSGVEFARQVAEGLQGRYNGRSGSQEDRGLMLLVNADGGEVGVMEFVKITVQHGRLFNSLRRAGWIIDNRLDSATGKKRSFYRLSGWQRPDMPKKKTCTALVKDATSASTIGTVPLFDRPLTTRME